VRLSPANDKMFRLNVRELGSSAVFVAHFRVRISTSACCSSAASAGAAWPIRSIPAQPHTILSSAYGPPWQSRF